MTHIALFGGTFDPPHLAHEALVEAATRITSASQIWVMVNGAPPYRPAPLFSHSDRLHLARAAFAKFPAVHLLDLESNPGLSAYTVDSLRYLHQRFPTYRFSLLVGADQAALFPRWREPAAILALATLVVVPRPGFPTPEKAYFTNLTNHPESVRIAPFMNLPDLSSTSIRADLQAGSLSPKSLSPEVAATLAQLPNYAGKTTTACPVPTFDFAFA